MSLSKEIEKSFPKIEKLFTGGFLMEFSNAAPDDLEQYNFGLGTMIRLKLLRPNNVLYKAYVREGFSDRDEMSMEVIRTYHALIQRDK